MDVGMYKELIDPIVKSFIDIITENSLYMFLVYVSGLFFTGHTGRKIFPVLKKISTSAGKTRTVFAIATILAIFFIGYNRYNENIVEYATKLFVSYLTTILLYEYIHKTILLIWDKIKEKLTK